MASMDFASAATSAQMNLAEVVQHLMAGICMETGYEQSDLKLKVNVTESSDACVWAMLNEHDEKIDIEFVMRKDTMAEFCLQSEAPMFNPDGTSSAPTASAVKGTEQYTNGTAGVDLHQMARMAQNCLA